MLAAVASSTRRIDSAAEIDLDVMRAATHFFPDGPPHLGHAVADDPDGRRVVVVVIDPAAGSPPVTGPAGLGQLLSAE
jgi:hypothetical protein